MNPVLIAILLKTARNIKSRLIGVGCTTMATQQFRNSVGQVMAAQKSHAKTNIALHVLRQTGTLPFKVVGEPFIKMLKISNGQKEN